MVASSLASSRAPSPTKPPLPPPRRRSRSHLFHRTHSADEADSRTPSPSKGTMRTTMRTTLDPEEGIEAKVRSNRIINKHPNKHHEGDRKRWRDQITTFETKRYEGVWAANRGLLAATYHRRDLASAPQIFELANHVVNIVARDIWDRSKLPQDVLEEIWDLVDTNGKGSLSKDEFVVGMWLIDQRLKGRKLPLTQPATQNFGSTKNKSLHVDISLTQLSAMKDEDLHQRAYDTVNGIIKNNVTERFTG
ncbi:MAG: hypothetical protein Q9220_006669 [cf. Caloplaca sp. 1 TL-2023]